MNATSVASSVPSSTLWVTRTVTRPRGLLGEKLAEFLGGGAIEPREGFVEQRTADRDQGARDGDALHETRDSSRTSRCS